ncbi:hypothetical protein [Desulfovibrio sp.]|uniref:hypothetical protein n=1 Tax=Desulfovibrio sp. TaxID=885 RepID=UPI0039E6A49C
MKHINSRPLGKGKIFEQTHLETALVSAPAAIATKMQVETFCVAKRRMRSYTSKNQPSKTILLAIRGLCATREKACSS